MDRETVTRFKELFEEQRQNLTYSKEILSEQYNIQSEDLPDEFDVTSSERESGMRLRLRSREALYLRKINEALRRIEDGDFGECESCGDDIELKRLEARPTATFCVSCKEDEERRESSHIDGHRPKSLGRKLRLA